MSIFDLPVTAYMTTDLEVVTADTLLPEVVKRLDERRISSVPVVDPTGAITGVVSRTDLLHAGRLQAPARRGAPVLTLPPRRAAELVTRAPLVVMKDATLRDAARQMVEASVHRVYVTDHGAPVGVISALDLTRAVADEREARPLSEIMSAPILSVRAEQPISVAIEKLDRAHVTGLVVVDEDWPIGVFTQLEALQARDLPRDTPVDDLHEPSIICMPRDTKLHRAAAQAARLDVRRVIVCAKREAIGVVSGLDFARVVAG
jgi:CBS domain-containing protein